MGWIIHKIKKYQVSFLVCFFPEEIKMRQPVVILVKAAIPINTWFSTIKPSLGFSQARRNGLERFFVLGFAEGN